MNRTKVFYLFIAIVITLFAAAGCSSNSVSEESAVPTETESSTSADDTAASDTTFTLEELKAYDGQNGNPAYIAVDGTIYDVTGVKAWKEGKHNGQTAGNDLSDAIGNAPHGTSVLKDLPVVGTLE